MSTVAVPGVAESGGDVRRVLVVAAMERETSVLRRELARRGRPVAADASAGPPSWRLQSDGGGSVQVTVTHCGVGPAAVRSWLGRQPSQRSATEILVLGYAGGLDPALGPGDVAWPEEGGALEPDGESTTSAVRWRVGGALDGASTSGRPPSGSSVWSVSRPLLRPRSKQRLWERLGQPPGALVDMETAELVHGLLRLGYAEAAVRVCRVVTDTAEEALPRVIDEVRPDGSIAAGRLLLAVVRRPGTLFALLRLAGRARVGSRRLAAEVLHWLDSA